MLDSQNKNFEKDFIAQLKHYRAGKLSEKNFLRSIKEHIYQDRFQIIGNTAQFERNRKERTGIAEVIFAEGKSYANLKKIVFALLHAPTLTAGKAKSLYRPHVTADFLISRLDALRFEKLESDYLSVFKTKLPLIYYPEARIAHTLTRNNKKPSIPKKLGHVAVVTAGTSDLGVAEECVVTLNCWGVAVERYYDVGVAALERLLNIVDNLNRAQVVVVVAGMEAALASVVGGLVRPPIIAVPTSVGYGAHLKGVTALLGMLDSCAPGMAVVNIDNGFGAASMAYKILHT